jgi:hypothetical protein
MENLRHLSLASSDFDMDADTLVFMHATRRVAGLVLKLHGQTRLENGVTLDLLAKQPPERGKNTAGYPRAKGQHQVQGPSIGEGILSGNTAVDFEGNRTSVQRNRLCVSRSTRPRIKPRLIHSFKSAIFSTSFNSR